MEVWPLSQQYSQTVQLYTKSIVVQTSATKPLRTILASTRTLAETGQ